MILFYVGAAALLSATGSHYSALHVHHLYLGFAMAMWAEFDHPVRSQCWGLLQLHVFHVRRRGCWLAVCGVDGTPADFRAWRGPLSRLMPDAAGCARMQISVVTLALGLGIFVQGACSLTSFCMALPPSMHNQTDTHLMLPYWFPEDVIM